MSSTGILSDNGSISHSENTDRPSSRASPQNAIGNYSPGEREGQTSAQI
ncbi:hypothetical protein QUB08_19975 [Microcoleus sp. BR0-C5]